MKMSGSERNETIAEINVVPLVDIVLVILIIFMVSAPVFIKSSINVTLPKAASGAEGAKSPLNITINVDGQIDLNGAPVSKEELFVLVRALIQTEPQTPAIISADKDVAHGKVIEVVDGLQLSGVTKFAINVDSEQSAPASP